MDYERHHVVVLVLAVAIILIIGLYGLAENSRMAMAEERHMRESIERGLELYARNCSTCHGPVGEGCIGMPLNRSDYRGNPAQNRSVADFLEKTISNGRPGTGVPSWVKLHDGRWASYTAMPAFARSQGGPLNEMHIKDLVNFIMLGDWSKVFSKVKEIEGGIDQSKLSFRDAPGLTKEENRRGQELFVSKGCVGCHRVGSKGSSVAADLSFVGSWGLDEEFLRSWITNPGAVKNRFPVFWSNYGPRVDTSREPAPNPPTAMAVPPMTDQEVNDLIKYLMNLKVETAK